MQICKDRELIIDSTIFGMGRGAGNIHTELITKFEKDNDGYYDTDQNLLYQDELEEDNIENLKNSNLWSSTHERHEISKQINLSKNIKEEK